MYICCHLVIYNRSCSVSPSVVYLCLLVLRIAMLICASVDGVRNKRMVVLTADHNTPQRGLSRQILAGCPGECKKITLRPFLVGILTLKTVLQGAPEVQNAIFIQNPRYATGHNRPITNEYCKCNVGLCLQF